MEMKITPASIDCADAKELIGELNSVLTEITGDDGTVNFSNNDVIGERATFLIAYVDGVPYGCGALRQISENTAEVKRVYARKNQCGVGRKVLKALEAKAVEFGYQKLALETRVQNLHAIAFYQDNGYIILALTLFPDSAGTIVAKRFHGIIYFVSFMCWFIGLYLQEIKAKYKN